MQNRVPTKPLRDFALRITKGTTPTTLGRAFTSEGVNFIKSEAITDDGRINGATFAYIDEDTHNALARSILEESDVLFSMAGAYLGKQQLCRAQCYPLTPTKP
jgi:type I restriction enzyme S subunit